MRVPVVVSIVILLLTLPLHAQTKKRARPAPEAVILKEPADWRLENLPMPPGFAPEIKLKGAEEARFSPGMYDTASPEHLTYLFSILADDAPTIDAAGLKDFLEKYFRGLSQGVGRRKGFKIEPERMLATVAPGEGAGRFKGRMVFFDSFTDGKKTTLNIQMQVIDCPAVKKTCLIFLISPSGLDSPQWTKLRELGAWAAANAGQIK